MTYPHPDLPQDGLIYSFDERGEKQLATFARVDVTGLSAEQIAELHKSAREMRRARIINHLIGEGQCG